jgi:hypothetical protein
LRDLTKQTAYRKVAANAFIILVGSNKGIKFAVECLALLFHIWQVSGSNLNLEIGYPNCDIFVVFLSPLPAAKYLDSTLH